MLGAAREGGRVNRLRAELYMLTHRGNAGDIQFYARACRRAASVLELGTGYGRLLPALARTAREVVALELDADLLALARKHMRGLPPPQRERVALRRGDMRTFELGQRFERILLPYNGLYCLRTPSEVLRCFRSVRAHLAPGGLFLADVWAADGFHRHADSEAHSDDTTPIVSLSRGAQHWDVYERTRLHRSRQRLEVTYEYVPRHRAASVSIRIDQRYLLVGELHDLLGRAGLELHGLHGDFAGGRYRRSSEHVVFSARAAVQPLKPPSSR